MVEIAGLLALLAIRTYPRDVATARESVRPDSRYILRSLRYRLTSGSD